MKAHALWEYHHPTEYYYGKQCSHPITGGIFLLGLLLVLRVVFSILGLDTPGRYRSLQHRTSILCWWPFVHMLTFCWRILTLLLWHNCIIFAVSRCFCFFPPCIKIKGGFEFFFHCNSLPVIACCSCVFSSSFGRASRLVPKPHRRHNDTAVLIALFPDLVLSGCR